MWCCSCLDLVLGGLVLDLVDCLARDCILGVIHGVVRGVVIVLCLVFDLGLGIMFGLSRCPPFLGAGLIPDLVIGFALDLTVLLLVMF